MARVWYCANCGYEVTSRGRCHACRQKLTPSAMEELRSAPDGEEVGYRIEGWTDHDRGRLIMGLNDLGVAHRFEDDELVVDASDEERVDDLVASLGVTAEEAPQGDGPSGSAPAGSGVADGGSGAGSAPAGSGVADGGSGAGSAPAGSGVADGEPAPTVEAEDPDDEDPDDDLSAGVRLLADAAARLRSDPTDMHADADVAEASASVFMVDTYGPFDEDAWSAVGRTTRRLLSALGADEALEDEIRTAAGVLEKLLSPITGRPDSASAGTGAAAGEQTVYEMDDWLPDQKAQLAVLLEQAGIAYSWSDTELAVPSEREAEVEQLFDRVGGGPATDDDAEEQRYEAVAELFAACGRLSGDPTDPVRRENVRRWIEESEGPPLIGMDEIDWFRIRTRARNLSALLDGSGEAEDVFAEATALHDMLRAFV